MFPGLKNWRNTCARITGTRGSRVITPVTLNLDISWKSVVNFAFWPFYFQISSPRYPFNGRSVVWIPHPVWIFLIQQINAIAWNFTLDALQRLGHRFLGKYPKTYVKYLIIFKQCIPFVYSSVQQKLAWCNADGLNKQPKLRVVVICVHTKCVTFRS